MLAPKLSLDHKYSAFGRVIEGMATVDAIAVGEPPAQPTRIVRASIGGPLAGASGNRRASACGDSGSRDSAGNRNCAACTGDGAAI